MIELYNKCTINIDCDAFAAVLCRVIMFCYIYFGLTRVFPERLL